MMIVQDLLKRSFEVFLDVKRIGMQDVDVQEILKVIRALENNPILVICFEILDKYLKMKLPIQLLMSQKFDRESFH